MRIKIIIILLTFSLILPFSQTAQAANLSKQYFDITENDLKNSIIMSPQSSKAFIDGNMVSAVQPIVKDGRTLVPLRFISEGFGAKVDFNAKSNTITIKHSGKSIALKIGDKALAVNGKHIQMDVAANLYHNSTYIPLRYIGEAFDKKVVYLKNENIQPYSLIIIRDVNATALENLNLVRLCELLYQGKSVVYSDRFMAVIKEKGQLFYSNDFSYFKPFVYQEFVEDKNVVKLGDLWFKTDRGNFYMDYAYATTGEFILYYVDGQDISRVAIEKAPIKAVKTYQNNVYFLTRYERGVVNAHETSNLKYATLKNGQWVSDYLGKPGFYYGFDTLANPYNWKIDDNGIYIFGYNRFGNLSSDERKETFGNYRIDLEGHNHEVVNP
ncbi:copper amine oxidase N-terminal domain-containing protein [Lysinibacillus sp. NPDC093688]|uniref:copper amine oxidase N-terminal domain-containing protein n=1 Tax=Lysinibacillus sp. NPDC093688 TaxID=3390577 RepID=UPI003D046D0D